MTNKSALERFQRWRTMKKYIKFVGIATLIGAIGYVTVTTVIAENNDPVGDTGDVTATIENIDTVNEKPTGWLRRATAKVTDWNNLEERIQQAAEQGEQILDERFQQVHKQTRQMAETLTESLRPQKEPTSVWLGWLLLYGWYVFCSPYAFFVYMIMVLFTLYWQYVIEHGKRRIFSGSPLYCIFLCLSIIIGFFIALNTCSRGAIWEQIWNDPFALLLPNSIVLLICYFRVSMVPEEHYEKGEDRFYRTVADEFPTEQLLMRSPITMELRSK